MAQRMIIKIMKKLNYQIRLTLEQYQYCIEVGPDIIRDLIQHEVDWIKYNLDTQKEESK